MIGKTLTIAEVLFRFLIDEITHKLKTNLKATDT
jgi:hypothetical protein